MTWHERRQHSIEEEVRLRMTVRPLVFNGDLEGHIGEKDLHLPAATKRILLHTSKHAQRIAALEDAVVENREYLIEMEARQIRLRLAMAKNLKLVIRGLLGGLLAAAGAWLWQKMV